METPPFKGGEGSLVLGLPLAFSDSSGGSGAARYVVGFSDPSVLDAVRRAGGTVLKVLWEIRAAAVLIPESAVNHIKSLQGVRYVEPDYEARALELSSYSDYSDVLWNVRIINTDKAWDSYYPTYGQGALGYGVVVAVLDTGIYYRHPELQGRVVWCANTVESSTYTGYDLNKCTDRNGHGTHVAGIIASAINSVGNAGLAVHPRVVI